MGGKCSPSGGINVMFGFRIDTKDPDKNRWGKPSSRTDLYPDPENQNSEDLIMSRWYDENGWAIRDRDYSDHGFPEAHPNPHDHTFNWKHRLRFPERSTQWVEPSRDYC